MVGLADAAIIAVRQVKRKCPLALQVPAM